VILYINRGCASTGVNEGWVESAGTGMNRGCGGGASTGRNGGAMRDGDDEGSRAQAAVPGQCRHQCEWQPWCSAGNEAGSRQMQG
jgi:hypothetical protein